MQKSYLFLKQMAYRGAIVLYVDSTRQQGGLAVKNAAMFANIPYIANLWAGGTLTNFREVVYKVTRKARNRVANLATKTSRYVSGLYKLDFVPEVVVSSSEFHSPFTVSESNLLRIPSLAIVDTNVISLESTYPILFNDDSFLTLKFMFFVLSSSYWFGRADFSMRYLGVTNISMYKYIQPLLTDDLSIIKRKN